jgi:hypothetical protein
MPVWSGYGPSVSLAATAQAHSSNIITIHGTRGVQVEYQHKTIVKQPHRHLEAAKQS